MSEKEEILVELKSLFENLAYDYAEEIESLADKSDLEQKYDRLEVMRKRFSELISQL